MLKEILQKNIVASDRCIENILKDRVIGHHSFKKLLEPCQSHELELMAKRVSEEHLKFFGKVILLYTPLYIANHCINQCTYCGYNAKQKIRRHQMTQEEIHLRAKEIAETGLKHILLLTGESPQETPVDYILIAVKILKEYFESVAIEIYPLSEKDYKRMIEAGVDSLTIYQEVYDEARYKEVHPYGPKSDYDFRLNAPERGAKAGMYSVNIGVLLGLNDYVDEVYKLGMHLKYLQDHYPDLMLAVSVPRIRPFGDVREFGTISDRQIVQIILALKLFLPSVGVTLSTRESAIFREHLLPLGISKMSAGVSTAVGDAGDEQFEIDDKRSVDQIVDMLKEKGYQAIMKDWFNI